MSAENFIKRLENGLKRGLTKACIHMTNETKKLISVPAPRRRVVARNGSIYWRATTRATPGAPPRKLSGNLRRSVSYDVDMGEFIGRVGTNVNYGRFLEYMDHRWLSVILSREISTAQSIIIEELRKA